MAPDIEGGTAISDARAAGRRVAHDIAADELHHVITGDTGRDLAEVRAHLAWLEANLPPAQQIRIRQQFGALISDARHT